MWKIITQNKEVANEYKVAFKEIYPELIAGRYSAKNEKGEYKTDGSLMKLIVESNPTFTPELYQKLMTTIDAERQGFFMEQKTLIDIDREHKAMRRKFPKNLVIGKRNNIGYQVDENGKVIKEGNTIITSETTENVYKTGREEIKPLF